MSSVYDFKAKTLQGKDVSLADFQNKVLLIVNTASKCGLTPQFEGLEKLYEKHKAQGFEILGFPCNQFREQEPGSASEIGQFCQANYGVSFPMFDKIDVNGAAAHPLFQYLKHEKPGIFGTQNIKWNFTKFLIDRSGQVVARYAPITKPENIEAPVEKLL